MAATIDEVTPFRLRHGLFQLGEPNLQREIQHRPRRRRQRHSVEPGDFIRFQITSAINQNSANTTTNPRRYRDMQRTVRRGRRQELPHRRRGCVTHHRLGTTRQCGSHLSCTHASHRTRAVHAWNGGPSAGHSRSVGRPRASTAQRYAAVHEQSHHAAPPQVRRSLHPRDALAHPVPLEATVRLHLHPPGGDCRVCAIRDRRGRLTSAAGVRFPRCLTVVRLTVDSLPPASPD